VPGAPCNLPTNTRGDLALTTWARSGSRRHKRGVGARPQEVVIQEVVSYVNDNNENHVSTQPNSNNIAVVDSGSGRLGEYVGNAAVQREDAVSM